MLNDLGTLGQLAHDAAVLLIDKHDLSLLAVANVAFVWRIVLWVVRLEPAFALVLIGSLRTLKEGGALRQNCLKGIDVLLCDRARALAEWRKLYSCECPALWTQVPPWYQVAARWLVVYLRRRRQWEIELGREIEV
jgi:hypothetical protein